MKRIQRIRVGRGRDRQAMKRIQRIRAGRGRDRQAVKRIQRIRAGRVSTAKKKNLKQQYKYCIVVKICLLKCDNC